MKKFKKVLIGALLTCAAVCVSTAAAACKDKNADYSEYPAYREPAGYVPPVPDDDPTENEEFNGTYTVRLSSMGGLKLNGVHVDALKNGATVMSGISIDGIVEFSLDKGVYDIEIDSSTLPEGYYIPSDAEYVTEADKAFVDIKLPSRVISHTASSGTSYSVGDIMYDFGYNEVGGARYTLSDLFSDTDIKAVVINFFFTTCGPCQAEFPAIQAAYEAYSDKVALVALSNQDGVDVIRNFKETRGLTFHMAYDSAGVTGMFNISNFPTTVIVDRYGAVAYRSMGTLPNEAVWKGLFNTYTSDSYTQTAPDDTEAPTERVKPKEGLTMPSSADISAAINGVGTEGKVTDYRPETNETDAEYSWPWIIKEDGDGKYLTASNSKGGYSFAIVYASVTMESGDALSYEYSVDTETEKDYLYALINGEIVGTHSGNSGGWQEAKAVYIADHTVNLTLSFIYIKDPLQDSGEDTASIRNINIRPIAEIQTTVDQRTSAVEGLTLVDGEYRKGEVNFEIGYITKPTATDPYYRINYVDLNGKTQTALLLVDFNHPAIWAEKHIGSDTFVTAESSNAEASLYLLSYWRMSNYDRPNPDTTPLEFVYGHSDALIESYYLQDFSDNSLLPLTEERKEIVDDFIKEFYASHKSLLKEGDTYYEDQWLEFCYYFVHFGGNHAEGEHCYKDDDPIKGLVFETAYEANLGLNKIDSNKMLNLHDGGGVKYTFEAEETGVYLFRSETTEEGVDPRIIIFDEDGNLLTDRDDDVRYDRIGYSNFYAYVYLEAGKTYKFQATMHYALTTGKYNLYIEYTGETYKEMLRVCSTDGGMWTYDIDDNSFEYYLAIPVAVNPNDKNGYYYEVTEDYGYGSVIYVDFVHSNFFDLNGHSLEEMIDSGLFDFGVVDYTTRMRQYLNKAKANEGELYGLVEADKTLVNMLNTLIQTTHGNGPEANGWLMFACYYESFGVPSN